jgi:hypothetical protein
MLVFQRTAGYSVFRYDRVTAPQSSNETVAVMTYCKMYLQHILRGAGHFSTSHRFQFNTHSFFINRVCCVLIPSFFHSFFLSVV